MIFISMLQEISWTKQTLTPFYPGRGVRVMPIDPEQWRAQTGLFCASHVLLRPPRCKQPQPKVQADTLSLNMRITLAVLLVTLRTGVFYAYRTLQLLCLIACHTTGLLSSIVRLSCRRLRGVSVLLALCLVVVPMLLIMSGDVEENPGPPKIRTTSLGVSDLSCVREELLDVSHKWFDIGLMLNLSVGTLACVREQYSGPSTALREMLFHWLKKVDPPPTWQGLAGALESRTVGEPRLAEQLKTKYCKTEVAAAHDPGMSDSSECRTFRTCFKKLVGDISNPSLLAVSLYSEDLISSVTRAEVTSTSLLPTDRVLKLLDAVERQIEGNPDAFFSFVDVLREDRSQVYLADFLMSTYRSPRKRKREHPQPQLFDIPGENWDITDRFSVALDTIKDFLPVEPRKLKAYFSCLCHPLWPDEPCVQSRLYESAATSSEIIQNLFPKLINYQNTGLLRQIVVRFGCDKCKAALQEYLQHYSKFTDKKLCNMPNAVSDEELDRATGVKRLRVETNMKLEEATIADTETVQKVLGQATGLDPYFIIPAQHTTGSLILTFVVPESVCKIFCELCEEDLEILANCKVTRLQIEDCVIENIHEYCTNKDWEKVLSLCTDHPDITAKGIDLVLLLKKKLLQYTQYAHLENLLATIPQGNLHRVCSDTFLQRLAPTIGNWIELAPYLGITVSTVQQITLQYQSIEEQTYQALLQWKQLYKKNATHEGLVEFLVRHTPLSTVEAALNMISPTKLVQKACHVLQQGYLDSSRGYLWPGAPRMMGFSQRLGRGLKSDLDSHLDLLALDYSSRIENFPAAVQVVSVKSFLNVVSQKQQKLFLLNGPHGSGKTALLRRACSLWARGLCWRKFTLVFWVDMKALAIALAPDAHYSFINFMQYVVPEGVDLSDICDCVRMHNGQDILLLLDGIDSFTNSNFLKAILSEPLLRKGSVVTTSSSPHQAFSMKCSQYYLLGLSEDQATKQVMSYYSDFPQKAEDFFTFISTAPAIKVLCSNPPCLAAVLSVFDSGYPSDLPATWTQLFEKLMFLFIRQCPILDQLATDELILQQLAEWMYHGTLHHGGVLPDPLRPFFYTVTPPYKVCVKPAMIYYTFSLPWLTCSYLTAIRIHTLPLEEQVALMKSLRVGDYVWQFFSGLCISMNTLNHVLTNYCHFDTMKRATCLHEARNIGSDKVEMHRFTVEKTLMTAYATHVMLSVAHNSSKLCTVAVEARFLEAGTLAEIGKCLTAVSILSTDGIGELSLSGETGGCVSLQDLHEVRVLARGVAVSCTLKTLTLRSTGLSADGISALASALCVNLSLKELNLSLAGIPDAGVSALAAALKVNQTLEKLDLGLTGLSAEGASALARALYVNHSLQQLNLRGTGLSPEEASALASVLCGKHSFNVLDFSGKKITDAGIFALAGALTVNQNLEKIDLSDTDLSAEGSSALASALCVNHSLKLLNLSFTGIPDSGVSVLAGALRENQNLEKLDLGLTGLSAEGASTLASALCDNHSLQELNLRDTGLSSEEASALASVLCGKHSLNVLEFSGTKITDAGVFALAGALMVNQNLEKIDLSDTDLSAVGSSALASALCVNRSLKLLNLSLNGIPDAGVFALAGALRVNQSLEKLDLGLTGLSEKGGSVLASAMCVNHSLKELTLRGTGLSAEEASALASVLCGKHSLNVLDLFGRQITDAGVSALAGALRVNQNLEELHLWSTGLSAEAAFVLASALCVNHSLKQLHLSLTMIPDAGVSALAGALRVNQSLEKLDLGLTGLSAEGATALASALCVSHNLKELNLRGTGLSSDGASALAGALCGKPSLSVLDFSGSKITDAGVSALAGALRVNQNLEKLDLWLTGLSAKGASVLAGALSINHSLKELNLRGTGLSSEEASGLANALCGKHSLSVLDFSGKEITDAGVFALAGALRENQNLKKIDLRSTCLSDEGASALASALRVNRSLKELTLCLTGITDEGVSALTGALKVNQSLKKLDLGLTGLSAEGISALANALCVNHSLEELLWGTGLSSLGASALANALCGKHSLSVLDFSREKITDAGVIALAGALRVNQNLKKIDLRGIGLSAEGASALASSLGVNHSLKELNLTGIPDAGVSALAGALTVNRSLEKLDFGLTGLSAEGASALASGLCINHSLKQLNLSLTGIPDAGISALAGALTVNRSLEKLDFGLTGLSAEGASALASALCVNHSLKQLNLGLTGIADAGVSALAGALMVNRSLEKLDLGLTGLSAEGASALASALCVNHSLKQLNLRDTGLLSEEASALDSALCVNDHLKVLNFSLTWIPDAEVVGALRVNQNLEKLDLGLTGLSAEAVSVLASALCDNHSLKELKLRGTGLSSEGASALVSALCGKHSISVLDFSGEKITDAGASALAGALMVNQNLEKIVLRLTGLSAKGASALASGLCVNHSLKELNLFGNNITDVGVSALAGALRVNQSLEELDLRYTVLLDEGASALASALCVNHSLKVLHIGLYDTTNRGVSELADALEVNNSLRKLHLHGFSERKERLMDIAERKGIDIRFEILF